MEVFTACFINPLYFAGAMLAMRNQMISTLIWLLGGDTFHKPLSTHRKPIHGGSRLPSLAADGRQRLMEYIALSSIFQKSKFPDAH